MKAPLFGAYGVSHRYGRAAVLDDISFELEEGRILSLLGPNGSGKSTLLKAVAGILPGSQGIVRFRGQEINTGSARDRARHVVYVPPEIRADFPLTARETVLLGRIPQSTGMLRQSSSEDENAVKAAMERCLCWELRDRDLHTLSGGEKQLVTLARALAQGARILLLDEALSRMDLNHQAAIGAMLRRLTTEGFSIVLVAHDLNLASEWADDALLLKAGRRVAHGPVRETITLPRLRELYPGAELIVAPSPVNGTPKVFFGKG